MNEHQPAWLMPLVVEPDVVSYLFRTKRRAALLRRAACWPTLLRTCRSSHVSKDQPSRRRKLKFSIDPVCVTDRDQDSVKRVLGRLTGRVPFPEVAFGGLARTRFSEGAELDHARDGEKGVARCRHEKLGTAD